MADPEVQIAFTEPAVEKLREVVADYPEDVAGLRLKISGRNASSFEHALTIVEVGYEPADDPVLEFEHFRLYVEAENVDKLNGVGVHYVPALPSPMRCSRIACSNLRRSPLASRTPLPRDAARGTGSGFSRTDRERPSTG